MHRAQSTVGQKRRGIQAQDAAGGGAHRSDGAFAVLVVPIGALRLHLRQRHLVTVFGPCLLLFELTVDHFQPVLLHVLAQIQAKPFANCT